MTVPVLVTGATGFLGRHVLRVLAELLPGVRVVALVRDRVAFTRSSDAEYAVPLEGRLADAERWGADPVLEGCAGILHCAGLVRHSRAGAAELFATNVGGTREMVRLAARHGCRVVAVSTSGTVGCSRDPGAAPAEEAPFADQVVTDWPYYASKIAAERAARALAGVLDVDLVLLRPPVLLGPGDTGGRASGILRRCLRRAPLLLDGGYHFADVRDVAHATVRALRQPHPQPVYHLPGWNGSLLEFAQLVSRASGRRTWPVRLPARATRLAAGWLAPLGVLADPVLVEMGQHHWNIGSRHAARDLDYRSRDPLVTLRDAIAWMRAVSAPDAMRVGAADVARLPPRAASA